MKQGSLPKQKVTPAASSLTDQISKINDAISQLSSLYENKRIREEDFDRRYSELTAERDGLRERLNEVDSNNAVKLAVEQAVADSGDLDLTVEKARRLVLAFVEKIEAPIPAGLPQKNGKLKKCRAASDESL